jgi:dsRNA-specific ribonuclease
MRAEEFRKQHLELDGWTVYITSYRIGSQYLAEVEDVSSGVTIARGTDDARSEAEERAIETALRRLNRTRRIDLDLTVGG